MTANTASDCPGSANVLDATRHLSTRSRRLNFLRRPLPITVIAVLVLYPILYLGNYAGDSQVHLIYAENAASSRFFEFNIGEKSSGVTSPGHMLILAGFFKVFPEQWVPAIVKAFNYLVWFGHLALVYLIAKRLIDSSVWAWIATITAGLLPGSAYNANIGMENGTFGFLILLWFYLAIRNGWFDRRRELGQSLPSEMALGILLGLACWIRPEGFVVAAIALTYRGVLCLSSKYEIIQMLGRSLLFLAPFSVVCGILVYFHYHQTGNLLPSAGVSRILTSNLASDTFAVGPWFVSIKFGLRLASYFPITLLGFLGAWLLVSRHRIHMAFARELGFLVALFWIFFVLYSAVLGTTHLSRYVIFIMPAIILTATMGAQWLWNSRRPSFQWLPKWLPQNRGAVMVTALGLVLAAVYSVETDRRLGLDSQASLWRTMQAPSERTATSEALYNKIDRPQPLPISIALQEVQLRYWLDQKFIVRSLDGRVDPTLLDFAQRDKVDHVGYLKERKVRFLLHTPSYNRDSTTWSLAKLKKLPIGDSISESGLIFSKLDRTLSENLRSEIGTGSRYTQGSDAESILRYFLYDLVEVKPGSTTN